MKVKYGEERFCTFLIKDITFAKLMQEIKRNCSPLAHLPASNIRVRYRDEDGDMINLWDDSSGFSFGEMLRSAKEVKERDYKKIFLQASEIDSPLPRKMRRTDLGMPSSEADNADNESLPPRDGTFRVASRNLPFCHTLHKNYTSITKNKFNASLTKRVNRLIVL